MPNYNMSFQSYLVLTIAFMMVAILSIWIEKVFKLVNINQKRPTSTLIRANKNANLMPFITRYLAISLRYIELIIIAGMGLILEWSLRMGLSKGYKIIIPIIILFIPISFLTITLCVPKKSKDFFSPYWYEWVLSILLFILGIFLLLI